MHTNDIRNLDRSLLEELVVALVRYTGLECIGLDPEFITEANAQYSCVIDDLCGLATLNLVNHTEFEDHTIENEADDPNALALNALGPNDNKASDMSIQDLPGTLLDYKL